MGYCVNIEINLKVKDSKKCLKAVNDLFTAKYLNRYALHDSSGYHYSWVNGPGSSGKYKTLKEAFRDWRYLAHEDIKSLRITEFVGEKWGEDELLYKTIAPFVIEGEITCRGEDGAQWKYEFNNGKIKKLSGTTSWKEYD